MTYAIARVCFYYGWTYEYCQMLSEDIFWSIYSCIDIFLAEGEMMAIQVSSYPHLKDDNSRRAVDRSLRSRVSGLRASNSKTWTPEELAYADAKDSLNGQ